MNLTINAPKRSVLINAETALLSGDLGIPDAAQGIVLFAHGSGSSRHSPRNRFVAQMLRQAGLATLLFDLLTPEEEDIDRRTRHFHCDIPLLTSRLVAATDWVLQNPATWHLKIGYFGASTGSAAALSAAVMRPSVVEAIVSRGGRVDLVEPILLNPTSAQTTCLSAGLSRVEAPTLLIVGEADFPIVGANEDAIAQLQTTKQLAIVPRASHLFEEPGALEEVARLASQWFKYYLTDAHGESHSRPDRDGKILNDEF